MSKFIRLMITLVMVAGLLSLVPTPALAAAFTTASSSASGAANPTTVGATVTVAGSGAVPGGGKPITVYLAKSPGIKTWATPSDDGAIVTTTTSDFNGAWGTSFVMPDSKSSSAVGGPVANGVYEVFLQSGGDSFTFTGASALNLKPELSKSPTSGAPGTTVTLKGTGFAGDETGITAVFDAAGINKTVVSGITASGKGSWTATFTVPDKGPGSVKIGASGNNTTGTGAPIETSFTVQRGLKITPTAGPMGTKVSFTGTGFVPGTATIKLDTTTLETSPATITISATGLVSGVANIPGEALTDGPHAFIVQDTTGTANATFTVAKRTTTLELSPASGLGAIIVSGKYFTQGAPVDIYFDGKKVATSPEVVTAGSSPSFSINAVISVPTTKAGKYEVKAVDIAGMTATATFEVPDLAAIGVAGKEGPAGKPGADGKAGPAGKDGKPGADGKAGPAGKDGAAGKAGADGKAGATGPAGAAGAKGADGAPANMLIVWIALILAIIAIIVAIIPMTQKKKA